MVPFQWWSAIPVPFHLAGARPHTAGALFIFCVSATGSMDHPTFLLAILNDIRIVESLEGQKASNADRIHQTRNTNIVQRTQCGSILNTVSTGAMNEWAELSFLLFCYISDRLDASQQAKATLHMRVTFWLNALGHVNTHLIWTLCLMWMISIRLNKYASAALATPSAQISWIPLPLLFKCDQTPCKLRYCLLSPAVMIIFIAFKWKQWTNWSGDKCKHVPISHPPNRGCSLGTRVSEADS